MACVLKRRFGPQVSPTNPNITPPSTVSPVWVPSDTVTFTWPYASPSLTLTVRAPDLGDEYETAVKRSQNTSRGGTVNYYRDPGWPVAEILKLGFSGLSDSDVELVFEFLESSVADEVGLLDWLGRQWRGIILDPSGHLVAAGTQDDNMMSITFRGVLV